MVAERSVFASVLAIVAFLSLPSASCRGSGSGSIAGTVYGTDDVQPPVALSGHTVYLLRATTDVATALKAACPAGGAAAWKQTANAESERLVAAATVYGDSSRDARRRSLRGEWMRLTRMQRLYRDSAARVPRAAPTITADLVAQLSTAQTETRNDGGYEFAHVAPGTY